MTKQSQVSLIVGFSSDMGNAEDVAMSFAEAVTATDELGLQVEALELNQISLPDLQSASHFIVVTSTAGDGEFPDNGALFWEVINDPANARLDDLHFAVLALGDSSYELFCNAGKLVDERLEELGAVRLTDRVEIDGLYEKPAAAWTSEMVNTICACTSGSAPTTSRAPTTNAASHHAERVWSRDNPYSGQVVVNRPLTAPASDKDVRHYEIDLGESGITYEAGDSVAVQPVNDPTIVAALLRALGVTADCAVAGYDIPVGALLTEHLEIRTPPQGLRALAAARTGTACADVTDCDVIDLVEMFGPSAEELLELLRPLQFRDYSIASSPLVHPDRIHLTVATVSYTSRGRRREGVASTFLAQRAETVRLHLRPNRSFRLPAPEVPVIMVGPGTGVAPFRAFLQERQATEASGRAWLFFGDRRQSTDFLYCQELLDYQRSGVLNRLDLAFSRDRSKKDYVQHHMLANANELFRWLEDGAYLYVCGDANQMAKDVNHALHRIVASAGAMDDDSAHAYVNGLIKDHRYLRDVY